MNGFSDKLVDKLVLNFKKLKNRIGEFYFRKTVKKVK